jgi:NAD+-dependent protein deacetylase sirtuin 4
MLEGPVGRNKAGSLQLRGKGLDIFPIMTLQSTLRPSARSDLVPLLDLLARGRAVALAGAGCSTESGIPDYRGPQGTLRRRQPMQYQEFVGSPEGRARYWSRSTVGWPRFSAARPNPAHAALARLEQAGTLRGVITQNVDGLHQVAGSREVVELHGSLARVRCLDCGRSGCRRELQERLLFLNAAWLERLGGHAATVAPDGDAELPAQELSAFRVPACDACDGVLKPDVVFFGENVPKPQVEAAWRLLDGAELLLVVGSSLAVFSGRRFVYGARKAGIPIAIVNLGPTRVDELADVKVDGQLGSVLPAVARELAAAP